MNTEDVEAVRHYLVGHIRAEARVRGGEAGLDAAADELASFAEENPRLRELTALWTRRGPGGLDTFVIGVGASRWISRFDPSDQSVEKLLDLLIEDGIAEDAHDLEGGE